MLYDVVLEATQLRRLSTLLDHELIEVALLRADRGSLQPAADLAAQVSSKEEWADEPVPALLLAPGTRWFEWQIPSKGATLGLLVETEPQDSGGIKLRAIGFMGHTLMCCYEVAFGPFGTPEPATLAEVVHRGRVKFRAFAGESVTPEYDPLFTAVYAWTFVVPLLVSYLTEAAGGPVAVETFLQLDKGRHSFPQALQVARLLLTTTQSKDANHVPPVRVEA